MSRGRHRSPRRGACFMELASYLAGERWSAHPACTYPLLAALARDVNDHTCDADLARLADGDLRLDARIALLCARTALPVAADSRQPVMATSLLACERVLVALDGRPEGSLEEQSRAALAHAPRAAQWASDFLASPSARAIPQSPRGFRQQQAPFIVHAGVQAIALAVIPRPGQMLRGLLAAAISECASHART